MNLTVPDAMELLGRAADPASAARPTIAQITAVLKRARRRNVAEKARQVQAALRSEQLAQPGVVAAAYAATVRAVVAVITVLNEQFAVAGRGGASSRAALRSRTCFSWALDL